MPPGPSPVLSEPRREIIHETAHLGGQVATMRIDRINAAVLGNVIVEQRHQFSGLDIGPGDKVRHHGDAEAGTGGAQGRLWAVDLDGAADGDRI